MQEIYFFLISYAKRIDIFENVWVVHFDFLNNA